MTHNEKSFFKQLGARIAALRKDQGLTQVQLAEALGLTQQMVASYELGRRRVPVSLLPQIAATLAVSLDELIGKHGTTPAKRGPAPKLQQQIERIQQLPRSHPKTTPFGPQWATRASAWLSCLHARSAPRR
jgi:transcriptional regulator with XRE-family HTH domain